MTHGLEDHESREPEPQGAPRVYYLCSNRPCAGKYRSGPRSGHMIDLIDCIYTIYGLARETTIDKRPAEKWVHIKTRVNFTIHLK